MRTLPSDAFVAVHVDTVARVVRLTRSEAPFESLRQIEECFDAIAAQLEGIDRAEYGMLQDLRLARGRNDAEFEAALAPQRRRISEGFARIAVLVTTQVGRIQTSRYLKEDGLLGRVFLDEDEALRWLRAKD